MADPLSVSNLDDFFKKFDTPEAIAFRETRKRIRLSQGIVDVEDIPQEEWDSLVKRNLELKSNDNLLKQAFSESRKLPIPGTSDNITYAVHAGAPELSGGMIDPTKSKGSDDPLSKGGGDTKGANRGMAKQLRSRVTAMESEVGIDPVAHKASTKRYKRMLDVITDPKNPVTPLSGKEDALLMSASPSGTAVQKSYFGRASWNNQWTPDKTIAQSADLAENLEASTGGRGTFYVFRGVEDYTIDTTNLLGADRGETALLGKHKPIAGLSSYRKELQSDNMYLSYLEENNPKFKGTGISRNVTDVSLAWQEKIINEDIKKVQAGLISKEEIYGPTLAERSALKPVASLQELGTKADIKTTVRSTATPRRSAMGARVSYSAAMETVGDNIEKVMGRSKATRGLLGAATEASAAVAGGVSQSNALRVAGAAASILRKRIV